MRTIYSADNYLNDYNYHMIAMISFNPDREINAYEDLKPPNGGEEELSSYMADVLFFSMIEKRTEFMKYVSNDIEKNWPNTLFVLNHGDSSSKIYVKEYAK